MKKTAQTSQTSRVAEAWTWFVTHALLLVAPIPLFLSLYLTAIDKVAAGTLAAGIFVVLILLHQLPQMELLKAWGIEAKMRARLDEAEELTKKLRQIAIASARVTYHTLGWGTHTSHVGQRHKQDMADFTDKTLRDMGVTEVEISEMKKVYLRFAELDMYFLFSSIVRMNISSNVAKLNGRINELGDENDDVPTLQKQQKQLGELTFPRNPFDDLARIPFREYCRSIVPNSLPDGDKEKLISKADEFADIVDVCQTDGRVNDKASNLIDCNNFEKRKELYREIFGEDPL